MNTTQLPITYRDYTIKRGEHTKFEFVHNEYDGPEDKRIGTGDTLLDCMLAIDDQVIDNLISEDTRVKLEASIEIENLKKDMAKLNEMLYNRQASIDILAGFVMDYLKVFEEKFESDESAFNYEQMEAYTKAASYMVSKSGKARFANVRRVLAKMNEMAA